MYINNLFKNQFKYSKILNLIEFKKDIYYYLLIVKIVKTIYEKQDVRK